MIKTILTVFFGLVLVFFVMGNPDKLAEMVQAFIDTAYKVADAFAGVDTRTSN